MSEIIPKVCNFSSVNTSDNFDNNPPCDHVSDSINDINVNCNNERDDHVSGSSNDINANYNDERDESERIESPTIPQETCERYMILSRINR